ncbi:MAG: glyceraldehyde 3-phosphate dehydrogenase NAD-binding domain-containing protein, partial [Flavobacteriia bacterium]
MKTVGVNGFGRIGRYFSRLALDTTDVNVAVVNDVSDIRTLAHLFKYDSVHRILKHDFVIEDNSLVFSNGKKIIFLKESQPELIPWDKYGVETVIESTGLFLTRQSASKHLNGGARKVIISAPASSEDIKTVVLGVNDDILDGTELILSNASCTTNNAAPMVMVLRKLCEIESAYITT